MTTAAAVPVVPAWAPLRAPVFRRIAVAGFLSNVGSQVQDVATVVLMTTVLAAGPTEVTLIVTAGSLPVLLLSLPAGALADVVSRRAILIAAQLVLAAAALVLGVLTLTGRASVPLLLVVTFVMGLAVAAQNPAATAVVPELVPRGQLPEALSLTAVSFNLSRIVGPVAGAAVVAAAGAGTAYLINAVSFVVVVVAYLRWREVRAAGALPPEHLLAATRVGPRYVRHDPVMRGLLIRVAAFMVPASAMLALLPVVAQRNLGGGALAYGVLVSALGAGGVLGAAVLPRARARLGPDRLVVLATLLIATAAALLPRTTSLPAAVAVVGVFGTAWIGCLVTFSAAAQQAAPAWVRGRAISVYLMVFMGAFAVGAPVWGAVASSSGLTVALTAAAIGVAAGVVLPRWWPVPSPSVAAAEDVAQQPWDALPILARPVDGDVPAAVSHTYRLRSSADAAQLVELMGPLREARLRDGAVRWSLFRDFADPLRWRESYVVTRMYDHLRQHERRSPDVLALEAQIRPLVDPDEGVTVNHELIGSRHLAELLASGTLS